MQKEPSTSRTLYTDFHLYGFWKSSSCWRVRIALASKDIVFEYHSIDITSNEHKKDEFGQNINMMHQIPVLTCRRDCPTKESKSNKKNENIIVMSQSLAIIEFLEESFPDTEESLLPSDIVERARAREIAEIVNSGIQPLQNLLVTDMIDKLGENCVDWKLGNGQFFGKYHLERGLRVIESLVLKYRQEKEEPGRFMIGTSNPTLADACVIPQLYNARRFFVDLETICPTLLKIESECMDHIWFMATHPDVVRARYP
jgi:Glutathione S-transferase